MLRQEETKGFGCSTVGCKTMGYVPRKTKEKVNIKGMRVYIIVSKWCLEYGRELLFKSLVDGSASCQAHQIYSDNTIDCYGVHLIYAFAV